MVTTGQLWSTRYKMTTTSAIEPLYRFRSNGTFENREHKPHQLPVTKSPMSTQNKFSHLPNLSSHVLGAQIVYVTDEWFAEGVCSIRSELQLFMCLLCKWVLTISWLIFLKSYTLQEKTFWRVMSPSGMKPSLLCTGNGWMAGSLAAKEQRDTIGASLNWTFLGTSTVLNSTLVTSRGITALWQAYKAATLMKIRWDTTFRKSTTTQHPFCHFNAVIDYGMSPTCL